MTYTIAIVDDEDAVKWALERELRDEGYRLLTASCGEELFKLSEERTIDLILLDMKLKNEYGLDILKKIKQDNGSATVIMMTGYGDIETAIESIKSGAFDYITKPFNLEELKIRIRNALDNLNLKTEVSNIRAEQQRKYSSKQIIGNSECMRKILDTVQKVADSKATTVLIQGESGTGKELVAQAIHYTSLRRDQAFIEVNCTAIPENLLESELFGHEKGSFTDAKEDKKGVVELADRGTLFLDEIGDMPEKMQVKLLRVLQERRFRRVGGVKEIEVDIRVVASTNKNLEQAVAEKQFREDLYYRLKVIPIYLPPLRDRKEDVIPLARHFIKLFNKEFGKRVMRIDSKAEKLLKSYPWPGNVRELKNIIERAIILESEEVILAEHLSLPSQSPEAGFVAGSEQFKAADESSAVSNGSPDTQDGFILNLKEKTLEEAEKEIIKQVLQEENWNKNLAAQRLKINRTTLYSKIKKYQIRP